ncbi:peroxiredoxin family protein [Siansivirga zeaxanthinifaciens]|uniref:Redoxin n=1 Tax=Siansivirga zeaxanthinifaciens CC-SAMT-1 TaxID=1454006 RepID=A0A0C5W6Q3_9FLAO|nr:redoxin domain-containing protein [Siansivirga zeaxanthinifaciens]AJR02833.1 redoxin [Siansivirga zeaxanthinifaciens CC-SAMT-1]
MRKKTFLFIVVAGVLGLLSYLGYNIISKAKEKNQIAKQLEIIPELDLLTLAQKTFTKANLRPNTNTIFIYFNSECDFCQHEAQSISDNVDSFKNVQFIFVSTEPIEIIKRFAEQYKLNNQQNITFLYDSLSTFSSRFDANSIPYILIYNKNQKLIKKHKGQLNAKGILRALQ